MALSLRDQTMRNQAVFPGFDYDFVVQVWDPEGALVYLSNQSILLPGSDSEGSGLGLPIVRQIADAHRAEIALGADANDRGLRVLARFRSSVASTDSSAGGTSGGSGGSSEDEGSAH